jgi:hypothetical protein
LKFASIGTKYGSSSGGSCLMMIFLNVLISTFPVEEKIKLLLIEEKQK